MPKIYISGGKPLSGDIELQGAKNSALPILAAAFMVKGSSVLHNCPNLTDVRAALKILSALGCKCQVGNNIVYIDSTQVSCCSISSELMREMRSSVVFLGAILARCGSATITAPGGCELGPRPIDMHLKAMEELGFSVRESCGYITCKREKYNDYSEISLDFPSVGATENIILASSVSKGRVVLNNAAKEPEICDLADFINKAGGKVFGAGSDRIEIEGVSSLSAVEHTVIPDRIVAATYMSAASVTGGDILIKNVCCEHIRAVIKTYNEMGCRIICSKDSMRIRSDGKLCRIKNLRSSVYPGFPTDGGPLLVASLIKARGTSTFVESIFESRFNYVNELRRLGADIKVCNRVAVIDGVERLSGAELSCTDLRGGAAMVIAGLAAQGITVIDKICHIERGYEDICSVLAKVGADISLKE